MDKNIFYNAHHSPVGAFASFTLGYKGASGGLGIELAGPACQSVYIGAETETPNLFKALPFYKDDKDRSHEPDGGGGKAKRGIIEPFADSEITREITPCTDTWRAGNLEFTIYTPHMSIPDPYEKVESKPKLWDVVEPSSAESLYYNMMIATIPAVFVEMTLDNTGNPKSRKAVFGYEGNDPYSAMRLFDEDDFEGSDGELADIKGVGQGRVTGIFTDDATAVCATAFDIRELLAKNIKDRLPFRLGTTGAIILTAPANTKRTWRFAVCFFRDGIATSGIEACYAYRVCYKNIEFAASIALHNFDGYKKIALDADNDLIGDHLSAERLFILSMAIKSYYGCTQLLSSDDPEYGTFWTVVEGGYRMINTLDLAVDHLFFELQMNPWVVRSVLELYLSDYQYKDQVKLADCGTAKFPGGISFAHDMGVAGVFSPAEQSAYELSGLTGCYSYMTQEELVNWILCAGIYWKRTDDDYWLGKYPPIFKDCLDSMLRRDGMGGDDRHLDGVMDMDSCKTGVKGSEITTYDNVGPALGRARRNSYLAVKCWAAYLLLEQMFRKLKLTAPAKTAAKQAERCAATILKYRRPDGTIPALLEEDNDGTILPLVEGLIYPCIAGMFDDPVFAGKYGDFVAALKKHFETALDNGCKFPNGGWKMSTTGDNSWFSKLAIMQTIAEQIFDLPPDRLADKIHASWLRDPDNAFYAFSDQMTAGKMTGSMYYPRGVTAILWC